MALDQHISFVSYDSLILSGNHLPISAGWPNFKEYKMKLDRKEIITTAAATLALASFSGCSSDIGRPMMFPDSSSARSARRIADLQEKQLIIDEKQLGELKRIADSLEKLTLPPVPKEVQ